MLYKVAVLKMTETSKKKVRMETFSDKVVGYKTLMNFTTEVFLKQVQDFLNTFLYTHVKNTPNLKNIRHVLQILCLKISFLDESFDWECQWIGNYSMISLLNM